MAKKKVDRTSRFVGKEGDFRVLSKEEVKKKVPKSKLQKNDPEKDVQVVKEQTENKGVWYKTWWGVLIVIFLILPYFLIWEVWAKTKWSKGSKIAVTATIAALYILFWISTDSDGDLKTKTASNVVVSPTSTATTDQKTAEPAKTETPKSATPTPTPPPAQTPAPPKKTATPASSETTSQKNAVRKAKDYLGYTAFSHDGLVAQLEYEQFSHADAVYGADNSGGNWNEQAAKKAKQYMDYSSFSRGSLIAQLQYDKFTQEQAEYGANAVGL